MLGSYGKSFMLDIMRTKPTFGQINKSLIFTSCDQFSLSTGSRQLTFYVA